jgi:hypothetical protein
MDAAPADLRQVLLAPDTRDSGQTVTVLAERAQRIITRPDALSAAERHLRWSADAAAPSPGGCRGAEGGTPGPCHRDHPARPGVKVERSQAASSPPSRPSRPATWRSRTNDLDAGVCRAGWYPRRVRASAERGRVQGPGRAEADLGPRTFPVALLLPAIPYGLYDAQQRFPGVREPPQIGPPRGPLIPPLMGPPRGAGDLEEPASVRLPWSDATLRRSPPRSTHRPSMGLLRRPTPGEIVEGGRFSRPCGPGALSHASQKPVCGFAAIPHFNLWSRLLAGSSCSSAAGR